MNFGSEVVQVTLGEPWLKEFLNDGEIVGEGTDGVYRSVFPKDFIGAYRRKP